MIGKTISNYRILEKLGEGGMGVVYKAEDMNLHRPVALKFISREVADEEEVQARLIREARAAAACVTLLTATRGKLCSIRCSSSCSGMR